MATMITPWFRNFLTDIFQPLDDFQTNRECATRELQLVDCMEAYGVVQSQTKCRILIEDFRECVIMSKQIQRVRIMRRERQRQVDDGERPDSGFLPAPNVDSY